MKIVVGKDGKLETVGSADEDAKSEAEIRAKIAVQRAELRRIFEGSEQFFDDPMGKPAEAKPDETSWKTYLPSVPGVYVACTQVQFAEYLAERDAMDPLRYAYFDGSLWGFTAKSVMDALILFQNGFRRSSPYHWLRLVEAD